MHLKLNPAQVKSQFLLVKVVSTSEKGLEIVKTLESLEAGFSVEAMTDNEPWGEVFTDDVPEFIHMINLQVCTVHAQLVTISMTIFI